MGLGKKVFKGMAWSAIERISIQAVQFILGIVLARILSPKEYGIFAILLVFISISQIFVDSGFTKALVQKKNRTQTDKSTVFFFNIVISLLCYLIIWFAAPFAAKFYEIESLTVLLRVLSITLIINALSVVSATVITINLDFKSLTKINFAATLISGGIAIYLAYNGYGIWALVFQSLLRSFVTALLMWVFISWKPNIIFSKTSLKSLFSFGSKLLVSSLLGSIFGNLNSILIGKYVGAGDLGFFTRGKQFSDFVFGIFNSALNNVLLPGLSPIQDERELLVKHTKTIIKTSSIIVIPIFLGLAVMAEPIIETLLTDKWLIAVPIMQIFCIARLITMISVININLLYVIGRTDLTLKQEYFKITIRVILTLIALQYGILYIAFAELISTILHFFINTYFPGRIMKYGALKQIKDILPLVFCGLLMTSSLYLMRIAIENSVIQLCLAPIIAMPIYYLGIYLFRVQELKMIIANSKEFFKS